MHMGRLSFRVAGLIHGRLECLSAKRRDFGRCDAQSDPAVRQFKVRRLLIAVSLLAIVISEVWPRDRKEEP